MNRDKTILCIAVGIICIVLISVICTQFRTIEEADITGITTARDEELKTMLSTWKQQQEELQEQLDSTKQRIAEYNEKISLNQASEELLEEELQQTNLLTGQTNIIGEGIILTISDGEKSVSASDLLELVNELRLAGAEAISINEERIINMTEIVYTSVILVNKDRIVSPYTVKAIGNTKDLVSALSVKNVGFIDKNKNTGINIELKEDPNIRIPAYAGQKEQLKFRYAKEVEE